MQGKLKYRRSGSLEDPFPTDISRANQNGSRIPDMATNYFMSGYSNYTTFSILLDINNIHQQSRSFSKG
jgi:hypothetical protein